MKTQTSAATGTLADTLVSDSVEHRPARHWSNSFAFDLIVAAFFGFVYALFVMGPQPLNPRNVNWIAYDPAYHYIGWELYRQDPHLHWPITYTERLGYPKGESVSLIDLNPLMAVVLKPLSPLLPEPAQYFGIEVVLACALQFFFALRLFRLLLGAGFLGPLLCSAFFLLAPPLNYRFWGHYSLSNQWLLVAALYLFAKAQGGAAPDAQSAQASASVSLRNWAISAAALVAVSVGINPYLAFQVLLVLTAAVISLLWRKRLSVLQSAAALAGFGAVGFVIAYAFGLVISGGKGYASGGYRDLSMNLLAPFDPRTFASILFPRIPSATPGQYEGYNYLGAGILILAVVVVAGLLFKRDKLPRVDKRWLEPLAGCCLVLTLLALSTRVTAASATVFDVDPQQRFSALFAPLRATGRLFWVPYYAILTAILASAFSVLRKSWATALIAVLLVVQVADTTALRRWVRATITAEHVSPLKSPVWSQLGQVHQNLIVLPAWQCAHNASPGGPEGYRIFGFLAVAQKMRINSYQSARYTGVAQDYHCNQAPAELGTKPLSPDSAYIVSPELAETIARGPTGPGKCHDLDQFILCSARSNFGLSPVLMTPEERIDHAVANAGFEDGGIAPWSPNGVQAMATAAHTHSGSYSLAASGSGTIYQDINGLQPGHTYTLSAWVSASPGGHSGAQLTVFNPTDNTATSSPLIAPDPGWQQLTRSFTVGGEGAVRIHLVRSAGDSTIYWDDVHISDNKDLQ